MSVSDVIRGIPDVTIVASNVRELRAVAMIAAVCAAFNLALMAFPDQVGH